MPTRKLTSLLGNSQKLDGGAMFGNAPKAMWEKWLPADELNRITFACRALLIEEDALGRERPKRILLETGIGSFFEPKMKERFGVVEEEHVLLEGLKALGLTDADIDVVVLSHLHFDHAGGLLSSFQTDEKAKLLFPNATYVVSKEHFARAEHPHARDRASFVPGMVELLKASGRLELVETKSASLGGDYSFHVSNGHTLGLLMTELKTQHGPVLFAADLIPGAPWMHAPITMGYDRFPELLIDEKEALLANLLERNGWIFFTHDAKTAAAQIVRDERGKFGVGETRESLLREVF